MVCCNLFIVCTSTGNNCWLFLIFPLISESSNEVKLPEVEQKVDIDPAEDVTTVMNGKVRVLRDSTVQVNFLRW